jgi:hypothetical protein
MQHPQTLLFVVTSLFSIRVAYVTRPFRSNIFGGAAAGSMLRGNDVEGVEGSGIYNRFLS